jgi:hypothetical protein
VRDLFGNEITEAEARVILGRTVTGKKKRKPTRPNGYADLPGTGPPGETCRSCRHIERHQGGTRTYLKCGLMARRHTHGPGSDILAKAPACRRWEKPEGV